MLLTAEDLLRFLPKGIQDSVNVFVTHIGEYLNVMVQKIASPTFMAAGNVVKSIPAALVYTVVTIFSSYIFIVDRDKILVFLDRYTPDGFSEYYDYLKKDVKHLVGAIFLLSLRSCSLSQVFLQQDFWFWSQVCTFACSHYCDS